MQLVNADPTASRISVVNKLFADTDNSPTTLSTAPATRTFTKSFDRQRRQRAFDVERRTLSSTFKQDTQCTPQLESCLQAPAASCCCHAGCCKFPLLEGIRVMALQEEYGPVLIKLNGPDKDPLQISQVCWLRLSMSLQTCQACLS